MSAVNFFYSGENSYLMADMQSFNYMAESMKRVFSYLTIDELLSASRVCTSWNMIAMHNKLLWQTVYLKNSKVRNWDKCIDAINDHGSVSLDMESLLIHSKIEDFNKFWLDFTIALRKAHHLKCIKLYKCPPHVVEDTIGSLPQLTVLNATLLKNPIKSKEGNKPKEFMTLNLLSLNQMTNLTEVRIKGYTGISMMDLPSFEGLVNLKSLSLTSIKSFLKDICHTLKTLSTNLEFFEIGDCDYFSKDFASVIKRLTNLKYLRLENCFGNFDNFAKKVFSSIRGLDKLKTLEVINIEFSKNVKDELEKCIFITALLIIPVYHSRPTDFIYRLIIDCLVELQKL